MTAVWFWVRADLRLRWRSWVVLGLLAGITIGLAAAGVAGARRTSNTFPRFLDASEEYHAAVLANDPAFDATARRKVAALPEVREAYPFSIAFAVAGIRPRVEGIGLPVTPASMRVLAGVLLEGRLPNQQRADEVVVDENVRDKFGLRLGSTMTVGQQIPKEAVGQFPPGVVPSGADLNFTQQLRVVGIAKSVSDGTNWAPSSGFYDKYGSRIVGFVNMFVSLRHGEADFQKFQAGVERVTGHPVNVVRASELLGFRQIRSISQVEEDGLLLFALAVMIGGGVLVGQALVRAVTAGAAELPTWRSIGADRGLIIRGMVLPTAVTALVGAATAVVVAIALSSRFPIGHARRFDLDPGVHADWPVLAVGVVALIAGVLLIAWLSALWRTEHDGSAAGAPSTAGSWAARAGLPPALVIGSRLAVEPGRGRRAVPVRSALVGAVAGVLGVVACFTFRAGLSDAVASPERSGVVWDFMVGSAVGELAPRDITTVAHDRDVGAASRAVWARAVPIDGTPTPMFGTTRLRGAMRFVVLSGHAPRNRGEIAFGPSTMRQLKLHIGDRVTVGGAADRTARVVGTGLLPATAHTGYDQSAWMTLGGLRSVLASEPEHGEDDLWDFVLVQWKPEANVRAAEQRLAGLHGDDSFFAGPRELPEAVVELGRLRALPLALAVFFGLLAVATVAHALVTTVRRRRHDLAVLRSFGFTRRQSRIAIAWQATLFAIAGLVLGVPLGIVAGRLVWRWLAESFPVVYVPPLALVVVVLVVPIALIVANLLAAGVSHAAARIRTAEALRTE